jgi:hypothetical protein
MSWLVLFIVQTTLVATHRVKLHRKLGYFGVALWRATFARYSAARSFAVAGRRP